MPPLPTKEMIKAAQIETLPSHRYRHVDFCRAVNAPAHTTLSSDCPFLSGISPSSGEAPPLHKTYQTFLSALNTVITGSQDNIFVLLSLPSGFHLSLTTCQPAGPWSFLIQNEGRRDLKQLLSLSRCPKAAVSGQCLILPLEKTTPWEMQ